MIDIVMVDTGLFFCEYGTIIFVCPIVAETVSYDF